MREIQPCPENAKVNEGSAGVLYLVATPIGNLGDMSPRAVETLRSVALIAAEDTRHSLPLLRHFGIATPMRALHEHNENVQSPRLVERLLAGESIALISDAGTPLVSDPGFPLVRAARAAGVKVSPVPGPCAAIAALSVSGLACDRFTFAGFPPRRGAARREWLQGLRERRETLIFYESGHRIGEFLHDLGAVLPPSRPVVIARELTKRYETVFATTAGEAAGRVAADADSAKGEFVVLVGGAEPCPEGENGVDDEALRVLGILLRGGCSVKDAAALAADITGARRKVLYACALRQAETHSKGNDHV
jgi:16S rRNA (cytidine1402-2'-O)-methyltransferase